VPSDNPHFSANDLLDSLSMAFFSLSMNASEFMVQTLTSGHYQTLTRQGLVTHRNCILF